MNRPIECILPNFKNKLSLSHVLPLPALVTNSLALKEKSLFVFFHRTYVLSKKKKKKKEFSEKEKILRIRDLRHEKKSLQDKCLKMQKK